MVYANASGARDVQLDRRLNLRVEADEDAVVAERADRGGDLDLALVDGTGAGFLDGVGDLVRGHGAEEATALARAGAEAAGGAEVVRLDVFRKK